MLNCTIQCDIYVAQLEYCSMFVMLLKAQRILHFRASFISAMYMYKYAGVIKATFMQLGNQGFFFMTLCSYISLGICILRNDVRSLSG